MTALSVGYIQTYRDSVDSLGESVDMSIKVTHCAHPLGLSVETLVCRTSLNKEKVEQVQQNMNYELTADIFILVFFSFKL